MSKQDRQKSEEVWKDVIGYEGLYQVSNLGRVKSFPRHGTPSNCARILKQHKDGKGYKRLWLCKEGIQKNYKVHRLVAEAFLPNVDNLPQVNHKDENKANNSVSNLEWCNNQYNAPYNGRMEKIADKISKRVRCLETGIVYSSISQASRLTGISYSNIVMVCQGKYKQARGYHFEYET